MRLINVSAAHRNATHAYTHSKYYEDSAETLIVGSCENIHSMIMLFHRDWVVCVRRDDSICMHRLKNAFNVCACVCRLSHFIIANRSNRWRVGHWTVAGANETIPEPMCVCADWVLINAVLWRA